MVEMPSIYASTLNMILTGWNVYFEVPSNKHIQCQGHVKMPYMYSVYSVLIGSAGTFMMEYTLYPCLVQSGPPQTSFDHI